MNTIDSLLDFVAFTHDIRRVKRAMWVAGEEVFENDSEHGYQIAMTALYIIEENRLALDVYRAMALALVHDILEVHAGDTPIFGTQEMIASKARREARAVKRLRTDWPKLTLMHELIEECEARETPESKFVYALDKLVPILNNYLDKGRNWRREGVNLEQLKITKLPKISVDPTIAGYYQEILKSLEKHPEYFGAPS